MKYNLSMILLFISSSVLAQNIGGSKDSDHPALKPNKHMVFARTPIPRNQPGNATQTFKGDDFIYARVFFTKPLKEVLFLEKNDEGHIPVDVYVEDLTNHHSLYISFDLKEAEMDSSFFDFDILPDPARTLRNSKDFEKGRFSFFITAESLENKMPVFKFTIGDATGYIMVDFRDVNLQQVRARDYAAYNNAQKPAEAEEIK